MEHGEVVAADSPEAAAWAAEQMQRSRAREERRREVWGEDNCTQMVRLVRSFPTLAGASGLDPWDPHAFLDWALGPGSTSGSWHAAMFVLSVWNNSVDWAAVAEEQGWIEPTSAREEALARAKRFSFRAVDAITIWDEAHKRAFLAWCELPFWP